MDSLMAHVRAAAQRGDADSQFNLGVFYHNGLDDNGRDVGSNRTEALDWLRKAAFQGLVRAQCKLGQIFADESDAEQAYAWFLVASQDAGGGNGRSAQAGVTRMADRLSSDQIARATRLARRWMSKIGSLGS